MPPIALFTVPIALFAIPMTLFRISRMVSRIPPKISTTLSLTDVNLFTIASRIAATLFPTIVTIFSQVSLALAFIPFHKVEAFSFMSLIFLVAASAISRVFEVTNLTIEETTFETSVPIASKIPVTVSFRSERIILTPLPIVLKKPTTADATIPATSLILSQFLYSNTPIAIQAPTAIANIPPGPIAVAIALIPPIIPPEPVINAMRPFAYNMIVLMLLPILEANPAIFVAANAPIKAVPNASMIDW